jgi:PTS system galactitol-specific IIC component
MGIFQWLNNVGASVMVPIFLLIIALLVKVKVGEAIKNSLMVGIGLAGLNIFLGVAAQQFTPIAQGIVNTVGLNLSVPDIGVGLNIGIGFSWKFVGLFIPAAVLLNLIMLAIKATKTINIDLWNIWPWAFSAQLVYVITGSYLWSWVAFFATGIVSFVLGDIQAPAIEKGYDLQGISFPHPFSTFFTILAPLFEKIFESIPGFKNIDADPEKLQKKFGPLLSSIFLGFCIGILLALLAGYDSIRILQFGVMLAAIMIFLPYTINVLVSGLIPISTATRSFLTKRFKGQSYYIGLDCAVGVGQLSSVMTGVILIPITIILAAILPGNRVLPMADLPFLAFWVSVAMAYFNRNVLRGVIYGTFIIALSLWMATSIAPILTESAKIAGIELPDVANQVSNLTIYPWGWVSAMIAKLFIH